MSATSPRKLGEALEALAAGAIPVAGCTDLMVVDHARQRKHAAVVDLLRLPELRGIREDGGCIDIGAATTFTELRRDALIAAHAPVVAEMAATIGAWQIQNRATVGGNIANASPAGDSLPVWLALGAELVVQSVSGERRLAYDQVHQGYRRTALQPGELLVRLRLPKVASRRASYAKVGTRAAQAISKVVLAVSAEVEGGTWRHVRIAAGSVAATPVRLRAAEAACEGSAPSREVAERAAAAARGEVSPIDDVRSTAEYRSFVLGQVLRRMILRESGA